MIRICLLNAVFFAVISTMNAQTAPKYSNESFAIGVGARAFSMGNSVVASNNGITSTYWNPATLTQLKYPVTLGLMHSSYFFGIAQYDYGAIAGKLDPQSAFAVSMIRFGVDNIPNTLELIDEDGNIRFDRIKSFSAVDYAFTGSYARTLKIQSLEIGGNVKVIRRIAGEFGSAWGFGFDLSAYYEYAGWQFGLMLRDITGTFNSWTFDNNQLAEVYQMTGNKLPENATEVTLPRVIFGSARNFKLGGQFTIMPEIDLEITTDGKRNVLVSAKPFSIDPRVGIEATYKHLIYVRMGVNNIQREYDFDKSSHFTCQPNIGLGVALNRFSFDYALTDLGDASASGYSNVFSISYSIQPADKK
jgi:hypothetical protein